MTRDEWAKRPLAERIAAWIKKFENEERYLTLMQLGEFALDLPDAPAVADERGPMPWRLQIAAILGGQNTTANYRNTREWADDRMHEADALIAAAQGGV